MKTTISILTCFILLISAGATLAQQNLPFRPPAYSNDFMMGDETYIFLAADRLEYALNSQSNSFIWEIQGSIGGDLRKFHFKTEGELLTAKKSGKMVFQALYSRAISTYFNFYIGARFDMAYDRRVAQTRSFAVFGIQGLAPYFWEIDASLFISRKGDISASFEASYDLPITQRLIGQPSIETAIAVQEVSKWCIGSGFNYVELGFRLRYEIVREFAPYIGILWNRKLGETADFTRAAGENVSIVSLVGGLRIWF